ncbi:calcium-binding protein [Paracoccus onubensis]|uniref:Peptidase M10 serralysin C-terminal domain-containing protein n=1 Tax=Paracoccus onubensis TaxID=1675788 RepID=A0A418T2B8_9RHOB|nr:M10 family metallopeptidase C-terminal domain-containing protein [Paracoccus onubensis]RJE87354.1 hypothetical protein D3P04_06370 [Paracoccus onubensis]
MLDYRHVTTFQRGWGYWQTALADLELVTVNGRHLLAAASELIGGGLSIYAVSGPDHPLEQRSGWGFQSDFTYQRSPELAVLHFGTQTYLHQSHLGGAEHLGMGVRENGSMTGFRTIFPQDVIGDRLASLGQIPTSDDSLIYASPQDSLSLSIFHTDKGKGLVRVHEYSFSSPHFSAQSILDRVIDTMAGENRFLVAISGLGEFISTHQITEAGEILDSNLHYSRLGTGYSVPADLGAVELAGRTYIILASPGSSSLTVFRLPANGVLVPTDHVIDEGFTNFQSISAFDVVSFQGRSFIFAGGTDGGITVFTLQPDGKLLHLRSISDSFEMVLSDLADIETAVIDGRIALFASSTSETGITQLSFDPGTIGITGAWQAMQVTGSSHNDMLLSLSTNRVIRGEQGDDILIARHAGIRLSGGPGEDIFVPRNINGRIVISDFEFGRDQLDLSQLGMIRSLYQIRFHEFDGGISLRFHDTRIDIFTHNGRRLTESDFTNDLFPITHYNPPALELDELIPAPPPSDTGEHIIGTPDSDVLSGGTGPDIFGAGRGDDTVSAGGGNDTIFGHGGADELTGETGNDLIFGNIGDDVLRGGEGQDRIYGGYGQDRLFAGSGADLLHGEDMNDILHGLRGQDTLNAGIGDDRAFGGSGPDLVLGGTGRDHLDGGDGNDTLNGGEMRDTIMGGPGHDVVAGGSGPDSLLGGSGRDSLTGGEGDDRLLGLLGVDLLQGGGGNDSLFGGIRGDRLEGAAGQDMLFGNQGPDRLSGGMGSDTLFGGIHDDLLFGGGGNNVLEGGKGHDSLFGGVMNDTLSGGIGRDILDGDKGRDHLHGHAGNDRLSGRIGQDIISGGYGEDTLIGGVGSDNLTGGAGSDVFRFTSAVTSPFHAPDTIEDFLPGQDFLDMSTLNLAFIGRRVFRGDDQVRWGYHARETHVAADLDGDGRADLRIILNGRIALTADDFLL